jgi:hypothetical protein
MRTLPGYVPVLGHGEICFPQPLKLTDVTSWAFSLRADPAAVQALVDSQLNAVARPQREYKVAGAHVLLTFIRAETATSVGETIGVLGDREAIFWIPLLEHAPGSGLVPRLVFWIPYLFINVDSGLVVVREIWGYRKTLGQMTLPDPAAVPAVFSATTTIFKTFAPTTRGEVAEILRVEGDSALDAKGTGWSTAAQAAADLAELFRRHHGGFSGLVDDAEMAVDVAAMVVSRRVSVVNLKQFRDAADASKACYQAVIEAPCSLDKVHGAGLLRGSWRLTVTTCASHRIVEDLGLGTPGSGGTTTVPVAFGFWIDFDFTTLDGNELVRTSP